MQNSDIIIIGAGIVGLATGYKLLKKDPSLRVRILEKESSVAKHQTGNNSGVIHSGVYYRPGSLKSQNCLRGKKELMEFCEEFSLPVKKLGKLIVAANEDEAQRLSDIEKKAQAVSIPFEKIGKERIAEIEPHVQAQQAIWIPDVSIVSYRQVAEKLKERFISMGGSIQFEEPALNIHKDKSTYIETPKGEYSSKVLINCAGLYSDRIAKMAGYAKPLTAKIFPFRGEYYCLHERCENLVKTLIYPTPDPRFPFLGVHLTPMIGGGIEAGPNAVLAFAREGYTKKHINVYDSWDILRSKGFWKLAMTHWKTGLYEMLRSYSKSVFLKDLQKLVPSIKKEDLSGTKAGVRAQLLGEDGRLIDDFFIAEDAFSIHVLNAPSPAATASFAIGDQIADLALARIEKRALIG